MKKSWLLALWSFLFILCAGLGFIPEPEGSLRTLLCLVSLVFFLPPFFLLYNAGNDRDDSMILLIRNLSALSLLFTMILLIANFLSAMSGELLGRILYYVLIVVSSPMICSGYWALSLFGWACLLILSGKMLKK